MTDAEEELKFKGRSIRTTLERTLYAECGQEGCDESWQGASSIVASGMHSVGSGHTVYQHYEADYELRPNPNGADYKPMGQALAKQRRVEAKLAEEAALDAKIAADESKITKSLKQRPRLTED